MGEALISGAGGGAGAKIYRWKRYSVNESTTYWWHRYNVVNTTTYKWNKWSTTTVSKYVETSSIGEITMSSSSVSQVFDGFTLDENTGYYSFNHPVHTDINGNTFIDTTDTIGYGSDNWCPLSKLRYPWGATYQGASTAWQHKLTGYRTNYTYKETTPTGKNRYYFTRYYAEKTDVSVKGTTSYGQVSSTSSSAYPANGISGSYWYVSAGSTTTSSKGSTNYGYSTSSSRYTYPDNGEYNGYWYEYDYSPTTNYSQGSYIDDVFGTDPNLHPQNGKDGSYWYVYSGEAN